MNWSYAAATQTGTGHLHSGRPGQDRVATWRTPQAACIALADGAGSRPDSHLAAEAVTAALAQAVGGSFDTWYALPDDALAEALFTAAEAAAAQACPGVETACTLLLFAQAEDGRSLMAHIGDGYILGMGENGLRRVLSAPENGAEKNLTYFLSGPNALRHLRTAHDPAPDCAAVLLCSDGAGEALVHSVTGAIAPAASVLADWLARRPGPELSELLARELDEQFRTHTPDDMSIAALLRCDPAQAPPFRAPAGLP